MSKGFLHGGGGGTPLNFNVVGNPQPTNPKENTIWLNTDVPIGRWYFSATQPEGLNEGDVWFPTGTYSNVAFNALKKNGIQVYPISAKQYIGGAWVDKQAKSYQGGAWKEWSVYLYDYGQEYTELTGGWIETNPQSGLGWPKGTTTKNADNLYIAVPDDGYSSGFATAKTIDVTSFNTLKFDVVLKDVAYARFNLCTGTNYADSSIASCDPMHVTSNEVISLDISKVTGKYKVSMGVWGGTSKATIRRIWFE